MKTQHFSSPFNKTLSSQPAVTFDADLSGAWSWAPEHGCVNYTRRPAARPCRVSSQHQIWRELSLKPNKQTQFKKNNNVAKWCCILHFLCCNTLTIMLPASTAKLGLASKVQCRHVKEGLLLLCCVSLIWIKVVKVNGGGHSWFTSKLTVSGNSAKSTAVKKERADEVERRGRAVTIGLRFVQSTLRELKVTSGS